MNDSDVLSFIEKHFSDVKRGTGHEVHVLCPFCGEQAGKRGRLYINTDPNADIPGLFHCKLCDERGSLVKLKKFFGDTSEDHSNEKTVQYSRKIFVDAVRYLHERLLENYDVLNWLNDVRGLSMDTIYKFKLGWDDGGLTEYLLSLGHSLSDINESGLSVRGHDFLEGQITIPYRRLGGDVLSIRGKKVGGKYKTPKGHPVLLFNSDAANNETVIICEGEFDCMILTELGYDAVALPGAGVWKDSFAEFFKECKRVYVMFDPDEAGVRGAEKVASKLVGSKIVSLPELENKDGSLADVSDLVLEHGKTKQDFDFWLVQAKGGILVSVDEAYAEWLEIEGNPDLNGLKLGLEVVDVMIEPGLLPAQVLIVLAKTGVGKTISLLNIFHRMSVMQPDKKILFVSLEQTRNEWFERARRIYRFYDLESTNEDVLDWFRPRFMMVDKNRVTEEELCNCIDQFQFELGQKPDLVAVDYLGYWARSYTGEAYERTSAAVHAMKAIAKEYRVPFIAPHQVSRLAHAGKEPDLNSARDSGVVEETADFIFALWSPDQTTGRTRDERTGETKLKILKSRHGGVGTMVTMQFAPLCLTLIPKGDTLWQRAVNDHSYALHGENFDSAVRMHLDHSFGRTIPEDEF